MLSNIQFPEDFTYVPSSVNIVKQSEPKSLEKGKESSLSLLVDDQTNGPEQSHEQFIDDLENDYIWEQFSKKLPNLVIKDCIPDGNCQFRSIENALYQYNNKYTHIKLRKMVGNYILNLPESDFLSILNNYKIEKDNDEFLGHWDPYKVKTKTDFIKNINIFF